MIASFEGGTTREMYLDVKVGDVVVVKIAKAFQNLLHAAADLSRHTTGKKLEQALLHNVSAVQLAGGGAPTSSSLTVVFLAILSSNSS